MKFDDICASYQNTAEWHGDIFDQFYIDVQNTPYLKEHRDWIEENNWGCGDRPFHAMWEIIIETIPDHFRMAEIGVYRGQYLSLVGMLAIRSGKIPELYGISPFAGTSDTVNTYSIALDYLSDVKTALNRFAVPQSFFTPIVGMSQNPDVISEAGKHAPYDLLYIDGSHEYGGVRQDIENYTPMLSVGGILVMDDAACNLNMPPFSQDKGYNRCWAGIQQVSDAVRDHLDTRSDFKHCFCIGHNRVYRKVA